MKRSSEVSWDSEVPSKRLKEAPYRDLERVLQSLKGMRHEDLEMVLSEVLKLCVYFRSLIVASLPNELWMKILSGINCKSTKLSTNCSNNGWSFRSLGRSREKVLSFGCTNQKHYVIANETCMERFGFLLPKKEPEFLGKFYLAKRLEFEWYPTRLLPEEWCQFKNLEYLKLISILPPDDLGYGYFPIPWKDLPQLKLLSLPGKLNLDTANLPSSLTSLSVWTLKGTSIPESLKNLRFNSHRGLKRFLPRLTNLTSLEIEYDSDHSSSYITNLTNLTALCLPHNITKNINLSSMINLQHLALSGNDNKINNDIPYTNLLTLRISDSNPQFNYCDLSSLTQLTDLDIGTHVVDIDYRIFPRLTRLQNIIISTPLPQTLLSLSGAITNDLLDSVPNLTCLQSNQAENYPSLTNLTNLKVLKLRKVAYKDIRNLTNLVSIGVLDKLPKEDLHRFPFLREVRRGDSFAPCYPEEDVIELCREKRNGIYEVFYEDWW